MRTLGKANIPAFRLYSTLQFNIPTARDATRAMVMREMADSAIMRTLALGVSGKVSAGENAVALV
jgi:hypothetical protein